MAICSDAAPPRGTLTSLRSWLMKPDRSAFTLYTPGARLMNWKPPLLSEILVWLPPISLSELIVTVAPGSAWPLASVTVPMRRPVVVCACNGATIIRAATTTSAVRTFIYLNISLPPSSS